MERFQVTEEIKTQIAQWNQELKEKSAFEVIGFFLDFIEITFIHVPVLAPIMIDFGYDPIWFCILLAVNLQTSFLTPPFGFSLFYLKAVTPPEITTGHIYRGIIPFVIFQLLGLAIVVFVPQLATWLPKLVFGP